MPHIPPNKFTAPKRQASERGIDDDENVNVGGDSERQRLFFHDFQGGRVIA